MNTSKTPTLEARIEEIAPMLRKFAAHRTGTGYSHDLAAMAPEAQDLYQVAVEEIITTCSPTDTKSYMLNLANWRMQNATKREATQTTRVIADEYTEDGDTIIELVPDDTVSPEDRLIQEEIDGSIRDILRDLKPEQAVVARLLREGFSVQEIARKLDITDRAVRFRLASLRDALSPALAFA